MNNQIDESLLGRYFDNAVSEEERQHVEKWINSSAANKKLARQMARVYLASSLLHASKEVDTQKQLNIFWNNQERRKRLQMWRRIGGAAAILALPLILFSVYMLSGLEKTTLPEHLVEVITPSGTINTIVLPDSSKVYLNGGSVLKYPAEFAKTREVHLQGEAYFVIEKQTQKRFIVHTPVGAKVEVLGTEFNLNAKEEQISTTLVNGSVKFICMDSEDNEENIRIVPGQKLSYNTISKTIDLKTVDIDMEIGWKDGRIVFKDSSLIEVLSILSERFNADFIIRNETLKENHFTGNFRNQSLEQILDNFTISSNIKYNYVNKKADAFDGSERDTIELY